MVEPRDKSQYPNASDTTAAASENGVLLAEMQRASAAVLSPTWREESIAQCEDRQALGPSSSGSVHPRRAACPARWSRRRRIPTSDTSNSASSAQNNPTAPAHDRPAIPRRDLASPLRLELVLGHVERGADRGVECRPRAEPVDQGRQAPRPAPPVEEQHGGRGERIRRLRVGGVRPQRAVHIGETHPDAARKLPVEPERLEAVPLAGRERGVPFVRTTAAADGSAATAGPDGQARGAGAADTRSGGAAVNNTIVPASGNAAPSLQVGRRPCVSESKSARVGVRIRRMGRLGSGPRPGNGGVRSASVARAMAYDA